MSYILRQKNSEQSSDDPSSSGPYNRQDVATDTQQYSLKCNQILNANGSAVDAALATSLVI